MLWMELLRVSCRIHDASNAELQREADEIIAIFLTVISRVRKSNPK